MSSVFWVLVPTKDRTANNPWVFVGTRTTKASALKLAAKELCSNRWGNGLSRVYEAKYDSYGNWSGGLTEYSVARTGTVKLQRDVDGYYSNKDAFVHNLRKQYRVIDGELVKANIEPPMYSTMRML